MSDPSTVPLAPLAADAPPTCTTADCGAPATFSYVWDWGQSGLACSAHAALLNQTAENLSRKVMVSPLQSAAPAPLLRDERVRLTAEGMVLKEELAEAKGRGLDLYRENVALTRTVSALTVRGRELDAQLTDAAARLQQAQADLAKSEALQGEMADELSRLRLLAKFVPDPAADPAPAPAPATA
jgi:hypothetical protein